MEIYSYKLLNRCGFTKTAIISKTLKHNIKTSKTYDGAIASPKVEE